MKISSIFLINLFISLTAFSYERNDAISIGPMLHMNIGKEMNLSIALELAYWKINDTQYLWSVDFGIEYGGKAQRFYSELQTGAYIAGISSGFVLEHRKGDIFFGFQGSVWANAYAGFDFRYRWINSENFFCPGFYIKAPIFLEDNQ